jgi:hypothetical protein
VRRHMVPKVYRGTLRNVSFMWLTELVWVKSADLICLAVFETEGERELECAALCTQAGRRTCRWIGSLEDEDADVLLGPKVLKQKVLIAPALGGDGQGCTVKSMNAVSVRQCHKQTLDGTQMNDCCPCVPFAGGR